MKKVTAEQIYSWGPCDSYSLERIKSLMGKKKEIILKDVWKVKLDQPGDYLWLVLRPEFILEKKLHQIAIFSWEKIARPIWENYYPNDKRPHEAIKIKKLWLKGKATDQKLDAARDVAWAAAWAAARAAARNAAWAAARAAARDADWDAAWDAARAAAWDVAWDVAWDAARDADWDAVWAAWAAARNAARAAAINKIIKYIKHITK